MAYVPTLQASGGSFLTDESRPENIFTAEDLSEEQHMIRSAMEDFITAEIHPIAHEVDTAAFIEKAPDLLRKAGELGFLGIGVSEEYGGTPMDFSTQIAMGEEMFKSYSFSLTIGVQTSIGIAPILLYGNKDQKAKYLPKMVSGEVRTCYCLTEPSAGSDANSGKTRAVLNEEGTHYILNGQKMWITNSGFAHVFIVFAKVDDDRTLSAFIVEKDFGGVSLGEEEKKMGIKGSSTRQVFFNEVPVPVENMLGERGDGFKMALNVLNTGRIKMASAGVGNGRHAIQLASTYAAERKQFGASISSFGAIQHKLGEMASRVYAIESALYRTSGNIDRTYDVMVKEGMDPIKAKPASVEEYAIECAMLKVYATEAMDYIVDEGVQIHGGMGFSAETMIETMYRDNRITRIYEGTNEINRMLAIDQIMRKALKGQIDLFGAVKGVVAELGAVPSTNGLGEHPLAAEFDAVKRFRKAFLLLAGAAANGLKENLKNEQEVLMNLADMVIQAYVAESAVLRTARLLEEAAEDKAQRCLDMTQIILRRAASIINHAGQEVLWTFPEGDEQRMGLLGLKRFTKLQPHNLKDARRRLAAGILEENRYPW